MTLVIIGLGLFVSAAIIKINSWSNDVNNMNKNNQ